MGEKYGAQPPQTGVVAKALFFLVNIGGAVNFVVCITGSQHQHISTFFIGLFDQLFFRIVDRDFVSRAHGTDFFVLRLNFFEFVFNLFSRSTPR